MQTGCSTALFFYDMKDITELTREAIAGLGVELVDVERAPLGLLRITIDRDDGGVTIEDCERVSKQLSRVLEVEAVDYKRLEVGSPGVDRPLRTPRDFERFVGQRIEIRLREPIDNRKVFQGILGLVDASEAGQLFFIDYQENKGETKRITFEVADLERAKLDPLLNFKGKKQ
jgi:ribosome maturation factor RimP